MSRQKNAGLWCVIAALFMLALTPSVALSQSSAIIGTVWNKTTREPIQGSLVSLATEGRPVRTDSLGRFRLDRLQSGQHAVYVLAVGYAPLRATVSLDTDSTLAVEIELDPVTSELARVVTTADRVDARNMSYTDFERRRAVGLGRFIARAELVRETGRSLESLLRARLSGTRVLDVKGMQVLGSSRGRVSIVRGDARCFVQVIVDNVVRYETNGSLPYFDLRTLDPGMIAAIEFYTVAATPLEFNRGGNASCGTLLIWMQN